MLTQAECITVVLPYQEGGEIEWDWENQAAGVYGEAKWVLYHPCE
jgi:hypothetical protein